MTRNKKTVTLSFAGLPLPTQNDGRVDLIQLCVLRSRPRQLRLYHASPVQLGHMLRPAFQTHLIRWRVYLFGEPSRGPLRHMLRSELGPAPPERRSGPGGTGTSPSPPAPSPSTLITFLFNPLGMRELVRTTRCNTLRLLPQELVLTWLLSVACVAVDRAGKGKKQMNHARRVCAR